MNIFEINIYSNCWIFARLDTSVIANRASWFFMNSTYAIHISQ